MRIDLTHPGMISLHVNSFCKATHLYRIFIQFSLGLLFITSQNYSLLPSPPPRFNFVNTRQKCNAHLSSRCLDVLSKLLFKCRDYFRHLLRQILARNALFEFPLVFFYSKNFKLACCLGDFHLRNVLNLRRYPFLFIQHLQPPFLKYTLKSYLKTPKETCDGFPSKFPNFCVVLLEFYSSVTQHTSKKIYMGKRKKEEVSY